MTKAIELAASLIKPFEGCRLKAYPDPATGGNPWTIGWGATGPGIRKGVVWTQAQADGRLSADLVGYDAAVGKAVGAATDAQRAAMTSLAYNIGVNAFASSTLAKLHKTGDYAGAAAQFARWNKAAGKVMAGLTRRRAAEAAMYRGAA